MAKYVLTKKTVEDLSGIWEYTCVAWSEKQADKYYALIVSVFEAIANHPGMGKIYEEIGENISSRGVGEHIIFYRPQGTGNIEIIRILHERMDLKRHLGE